MMSLFLSTLFFVTMLLAGFSGMYLAAQLYRKKYQIQMEGSFRRLAVVLLLTAVLGGVGQLLYGLELQTYTTTTTSSEPTKGMHIVVLMDVSGSMQDEQPVCVDAACQLIEGLDETTSMQFIAFAGTVPKRGESAFLPLTKEHKAQLQTMVQSVKLEGGTNFDEPLDKAIATLQNNHDPAYRSLIIMLTDGEDSVNSTIKSILTDPNSGIDLFTLRITDSSDVISSNTQALIDLAEMDFPIVPQEDGAVDISSVRQAFQTALNHTPVTETHTKLALGDTLIFAEVNDTFAWQHMLASVVFALYALLISIAYYGKPSRMSAAFNLVFGAVTGWITDDVYILFLVLCLTAFTILEPEEGISHV